MSRKLIPFAVAAALAIPATGAIAGGFGIGTQSGSGTGNAFAGGAAAADDSSVAWYNPAAMFALPAGKQLTVAGHGLKPSFKFANAGSTGTFAAAGTGEGNDGGDWAFVPNAFFTMDATPNWRFGVALNAPFGLKTDYDAGWRGKFLALKSDIKSVNINPSVAYRINDKLSIGAGVSVQKIDATLTSDTTGLSAAGLVTLKADDVGYGYNVGVIYQATPDTRFGVHYRSTIRYDLGGSVTLSGTPAGNGGIRADLVVPDSLSFSVNHKLNPKWELMGDITWTGWSSVQNLTVMRTTGAGAGTLFTNLLFRWDDTWRFGAGANYKVNDNMKLRFGVAFDKTPTNDVDRTPRLPDQDRTWIAIGVQHRLSKAGVLEAGYAHEFVKDASINAVTAAGTLRGNFSNKADILSLQYSHSF